MAINPISVVQTDHDLAKLCVPAAAIFAETEEHIADMRRRAAEHIARHRQSFASPAAEREEVVKARQTITEALMDSQYVAGAMAGWNAAQTDDPEAAFAALQKSREGHLLGYADAKALLAKRPTAELRPALHSLNTTNDSRKRPALQGELREAALSAALCLSAFVGHGVFIEGYEAPEDAFGKLVDALGMPDADDDDLRAALGGQP